MFVNTFFQFFLDFFRFFREQPFFSKKLRLIISPAHMRTHTYARARAYILIVFDFLSSKRMNVSDSQLNA